MYRLLLLLFAPFVLFTQENVVDLGELGKIVYQLEDNRCKKITRLSPSGEVRYEHEYYYEEGRIVGEKLIGNLGYIEYTGDGHGNLLIKSDFNKDIRGEEVLPSRQTYPLYENSAEKEYDDLGYLIRKDNTRFSYDEQGKLMHAVTDACDVFFAYNEYGKRRAKKVITPHKEYIETYAYFEGNEIGSFIDGELEWLRIPGSTPIPGMVKAIAIETKDAVYAPLYDFQYNIVKLINMEDGTVIDTRPDPFGKNLNSLHPCPWIFSTRRYDPELNLVHFPYRDYDPELRQWLTPDPFKQDTDPYRYCFNNPLIYMDVDGRWIIVVPLGLALGETIIAICASGGGVAAGYCINNWVKNYNESLRYDRQQRQAENLLHDNVEFNPYQNYDTNPFLNLPNRFDSGYDPFYAPVYESMDEDGSYQMERSKKPPFNWEDLGDDPTKCPAEGFEWRGNGPPESGKGNWHNPKTGEKLHPDLDHPPPKKPHWGYKGSNGEEYDIYLDGSWE